MAGDAVDRLLRVVDAASSLLNLARTGWMLRGVPPQLAETSGAHSFMAALLALELAEIARSRGTHLDPYRAALTALVHELPEAFVGDVVKEFSRRIGVERKEGVELAVVEERMGDSASASLFREFVRQETLEARAAKLAELLATMIQALHYARQGFNVMEIYEGSMEDVKHLARELGVEDVVEGLLNTLKGRR